MRTLLVILLAGGTLSGVATAQSLGEVARQEEARRKAVKSSGKVYTNDSLRPEPAPALPPPAATAAAPASPDNPTQAGAVEDAKDVQDPKKTENYWKQRLAAERDALSRAQIFAESLQSRINALTADFTARDDPAQRSQIGVDRQRALAELDRVRKEIDDYTKGISDIQEEGRKAGAISAWLR
jgi:hypothetical protein